MHKARRVKESCDAWAIGKVQHWTGIPLASVIRKRVDQQMANKLHHSTAHHALHDNAIGGEDTFDAGSSTGGSEFALEDQFELEDESASDGMSEYDAVSDSSIDT